MSNLEPPHASGDHDPFTELELFEMDPKVRGILAAIRQAQAELHQGTPDRDEEEVSSRRGCGKLNSYLMELGLFNDSVALYGKVRLAPWLREEDKRELLDDPFFRENGLHEGIDEHGPYWQLADHHLRIGPIDTDESEDEVLRPISYTITLRTEQQAREIEEEHGDPEYRGGLIIYPEDIEYMRPSVLSERYVEQLLMTNYSDLYARILELLPGDGWYDDNDAEPVADAEALKRLAQLEIPSSLSMTADFRESLGVFLLGRLALDEDAGHIFKDYQSLEGLNDDGEWIPLRGKKRQVRGNVIAIDIAPESHKISFVMTELGAHQDDGMHLYKMPATPEVKIRSARPVRQRFGKAAMWQFDSDEEAAQWYRARDKRAVIPEIEQFAGIVDSVDANEFGIREYRDRYETSIEQDLSDLQEEFNDHLDAFTAMVGQEAGVTRENTQYFPTLTKRVERLNDVAVGDQCVFADEFTIAFSGQDRPDLTTSTVFFEKADNKSLRGTIVDFCGAWFASPDNDQVEDFALAAIVSDPALVSNDNNDELMPLQADIVLVRIDDTNTSRTHRITYKRDMQG